MSEQSHGGNSFAKLRRIGVLSWSVLGVVALVVVIATALGALSGIIIPLLIAIIIGTLLEPLVVGLENRGLKTPFPSIIGLFTAILVLIGIFAIIGWGIIQQLPEIYQQLNAGWNSLVVWGRSLDIDSVWLERVREHVQTYAPRVAQGILGALSNTVFGAVSLAMGLFFAMFFLFFVLKDGRKFPSWLARLFKLDPDLTEEVVTLSEESLRGYFKGTAITAIITAPIFMIPLVVLKVPLVFPIFILYFFLSFIPFVGAWLTAAFAILIAFGSGGATTALIVTVSLLISNGTIQSAVSSWALGSSLKMHPVAVLLATLISGAVAGLIGMVLGPPMLAAVTRATNAIKRHYHPEFFLEEIYEEVPS